MVRKSVGTALDLALIGLVAAVVLTAAIGPVAALTGRRAFVIGGASMSPAIPLGSIVVVESTADRALRVGEVASFRTTSGTVVTHRVSRIVERSDGTWYETKGDANAHPDPALWPAASLSGRVILAFPGLGYASWLLRHPIGWVNVMVLAGWLVVARRLVRTSPPDVADEPDPAGSTATTPTDSLGRAGGATA